jgi:hypothetical protein
MAPKQRGSNGYHQPKWLMISIIIILMTLPFINQFSPATYAASFPLMDFPIRADVDIGIAQRGGYNNGDRHGPGDYAYAVYALDFERTDGHTADDTAFAPTDATVYQINSDDTHCLILTLQQLDMTTDLFLQICHVVWNTNFVKGDKIQKGQALGRIAHLGDPQFVGISHVHLAAYTGTHGNAFSNRVAVPFTATSNYNLTLNGHPFPVLANPVGYNEHGGECCFRSLQALSGNVQGHVKYASNQQSVTGATITFSGSGIIRSTTTDNNGNYSFANVPAYGNTSISANKDGYIGSVQPTIIRDATTQASDITISSAICGQSAQTGGLMAMIFPVAYAADNCPPTPVPPPSSSDGIEIVNVSTHNVRPGEQFTPSITIKVISGSINAGSDFLKATPDTDSNKLGAYPNQGLTHNVYAGQSYTFDATTLSQFKMTAPS